MAQLLTVPPHSRRRPSLPSRFAVQSIPCAMRWLATTWLHAVWIVLLPPLLHAPPVQAQSGDVNSLRDEIGALRRAIERLDAKVERLEQQPSPAPQATPPQSAAAATPPRDTPSATPEKGVRQRWQEVKYGMTTDQISALLGPPQRTMDLNPKVVWYYSYPEVGNGSVVFTADSGVIDWQPPPFNVWW